MTRVCLDCGTPKAPTRESCKPCGKVTITHEGKAREKLCRRCKFFQTSQDDKMFCYWTYVNRKPNESDTVGRKIANVIHEVADLGNEIATKYSYWCPDFTPVYNDPGPSSNPLSYRDMEEIRSWHNNPMAFWLDPKRWDHVEDPRKDVLWDPPAKPTLLDKLFGKKRKTG